jgi:hypothetical protein
MTVGNVCLGIRAIGDRPRVEPDGSEAVVALVWRGSGCP